MFSIKGDSVRYSIYCIPRKETVPGIPYTVFLEKRQCQVLHIFLEKRQCQYSMFSLKGDSVRYYIYCIPKKETVSGIPCIP